MVEKITLNAWMILLENHKIYNDDHQCKPGSLWEQPLDIRTWKYFSAQGKLCLYSYFNFRVTKDFVTWEQIWVAFLFIIIILLNDLYIYVKNLQSFFFSFENEKLVDTQISTTTKFVPVVTNFNVGLIPRVE